MVANRLITIPFALGQDEETAPRELPQGPLREAVNVRQRRGSAFGVRPDYPAVSNSTFDTGTLRAFDLYSLNDRLLALGDSINGGRPTDVFDLVEQAGGTWRGTNHVGLTPRDVPLATHVRNMGKPPDSSVVVTQARVAAVNGVVCLVTGGTATSANIHIFLADSDSTIFNENRNISLPRVVAIGDSLWILGIDSSSDLVGFRFDTLVDDDLPSSPVVIFAGTVSNFDAYAESQAGQATLAAAFIQNSGATTRVLTFNEAGTVVTSVAGPAVTSTVMAVEADVAQNDLVTAYRVGAADVIMQTFNLTTGASVSGPFTTTFGQAVSGNLTMNRTQIGAAGIRVYSEDASSVLRGAIFSNSSALAAPTNFAQHNLLIAGRSMPSVGESGAITPYLANSSDLLLNDTLAAPMAMLDNGVAVAGSATQYGGDLTRDTVTGLYYWARIIEGTDAETIGIVAEFRVADTGRRQATQIGGQLFIAGGLPIIFDGRVLTESGFIEAPIFVSLTPSSGAGTLIDGATYDYVAVYKWTDSQGRLTQSQVSEVQTVTLGGADNTVTAIIFAAHVTQPRNDGTVFAAPTISLYRTFAAEPNPGTFTKGTVFQLVASNNNLSSEYGIPTTLVDTMSDATLLTQEALYTQGERGGETGILEHDPPQPCKFCWTIGNRVFTGGLPDPSAVQISKALAPAEALAWSDNFSFNSNVDGDVTAVAGLDGVPIAFTSDSLYAFSPQLPNDIGEDGELGPARRIPSEGGCSNANSIVETSLGLFYQARDTKLMVLPRGGGVPIWKGIGTLVQDTLTAFPTITAAVYVDVDHVVCFTCQNVAGNASVILVYDLRIGQWYKDTFASAQVIKAAAPYLGKLAYIDGTTVRLQSTSLTPATFIEYNAKTGSLKPFGGNGWGRLIQITVDGEKRGDAQLRPRISYDDGVTFTNLLAKAITTANGFTTGESFTCQWFVARRKGATFVIDFQVLTNGTATEGLIINSYTCEVMGQPIGRVRTAQFERG